MEHVEVAVDLPELAALEAEAAFEERDVELLAVEGDDGVEAFEVALDRADERFLLMEVAHEVLADDERLTVDEADGDEEGRGAGAAREACGFGVDERGFARIEVDEVHRRGENPRGIGEGF